MKALDLYIKYQEWCTANNYARISFERFCELKQFFELPKQPKK